MGFSCARDSKRLSQPVPARAIGYLSATLSMADPKACGHDNGTIANGLETQLVIRTAAGEIDCIANIHGGHVCNTVVV